MVKVIWTKGSRVSLRKIWKFYSEIDPKIADRIIEEILETAESIKFDKQYQVDELLKGEFRRVIIRHYKIIYRIQKDTLQVLRVFDTRQDPKKLKGKM